MMWIGTGSSEINSLAEWLGCDPATELCLVQAKTYKIKSMYCNRKGNVTDYKILTVDNWSNKYINMQAMQFTNIKYDTYKHSNTII